MSGSTKLIAVRGAIQVSKDDALTVTEAVDRLFTRLVADNPALNVDDCVDIMFTVTDDICSINPAFALRKSRPLLVTPLFCMQEPRIQGMGGLMIRVMVHAMVDQEARMRPVYLDGAEKLRPDLVNRS